MADDFFSGIQQIDIRAEEFEFKGPVFYRDFRDMLAVYPARLSEVRKLMPDKRLSPAQLVPGVGAVMLGALEYYDTDIGPYNEFSFAIMVNSSDFLALPGYNMMRQQLRMYNHVYIHRLPVDARIALVGGLLFGFPKFMASIEFDDTDRWTSCEVKKGKDLLWRLKGRKIPATRSDEMRLFAHLYLQGQPICLEFRLNVLEYGMSMKPADAELELGNHPVAAELKNVLLSTRPLMYMNAIKAQGMLFGPEGISMMTLEQFLKGKLLAEVDEFVGQVG
jgi:Acetoacetate decarboxylase (ADC)